jgi:hypothetical protein
VAGRLVSGFGDASRGSPARGIAMPVRGRAQVVAPAAGAWPLPMPMPAMA